MGRFTIALFAAVLITAGLVTPVEAQSWNAFSYATFHGIDVVQTVQSDDSVVYNLSFIPAATINIDGNSYQINWLQGFYIRAQDVDGRFSATDTGLSDWKWTQKPPNETSFNLAGWHGTGSNRIYADQPPKAFTHATFDANGTPVDFGYHVAYMYDGVETTGFYHGNVMPEPSTLQAGAIFLAGLGGLVRFRRRR